MTRIRISLSETTLLGADEWNWDYLEKFNNKKSGSLEDLKSQIEQEKEFQSQRNDNQGSNHKIWKHST